MPLRCCQNVLQNTTVLLIFDKDIIIFFHSYEAEVLDDQLVFLLSEVEQHRLVVAVILVKNRVEGEFENMRCGKVEPLNYHTER